MIRKHPSARRATALTLWTSLILALALQSAVALHPSPAQADSDSAPIVNGRRPLPGDPNTPDEGRAGSTVLQASSNSTSFSLIAWLKGLAIHFHLPLR
ncbi:MAG: hypothetical protein ABI960_09120 [Candidatus Eisenbacteria bacterium]